MKFRLVEDFNEDLQQKLQETEKEHKEALEEIETYFNEQEFTKEDKLNGISFNKSLSEDDFSYEAQFYIDKTNYDYSGYVLVNNDKNNKSNFSVKGDSSTLVDAASQLINHITEM